MDSNGISRRHLEEQAEELMPKLPVNWHREPLYPVQPVGEFECRCTHCDRTLLATGRGGKECKHSFDIMTCCGCNEVKALVPRCGESYAPIPTAAAAEIPLFPASVIEAAIFDWPELTGKVLEICVGESGGHMVVTGRELASGHVYVLHQHNRRVGEEY